MGKYSVFKRIVIPLMIPDGKISPDRKSVAVCLSDTPCRGRNAEITESEKL